mgnify:CR=1 FL=1
MTRWFVCFTLLFTLVLSGCSSFNKPPEAHLVIAPEPIPGNSGEFMAPYTTDGVVAGWVDKAVNAKMGASIGKAAGAAAGSMALRQVPFVGGFLGQKAGDMIGREIAIKTAGGWDYIRETSDQSFNTAEDLSVWLYAKYSTNEHFDDVLKATMDIYPDVTGVYHRAIVNAPTRTNPMGE